MTEFEKEKIKQFCRDKAMCDAVSKVILQTFLEKRDGDMMIKASQRLAIDFHFESWDNLMRINTSLQNEQKERVQHAL